MLLLCLAALLLPLVSCVPAQDRHLIPGVPAPAPNLAPAQVAGQWGEPYDVKFGEWQTVTDLEDNRAPKGIVQLVMENLPSLPTVENVNSGLTTLKSLGNFWTWDRQTVYDGVFKNENIMIHVTQNFFNFIFTTIAWFFVSQIYTLSSGGSPKRSDIADQRAITFTDAADEVLSAIKDFEKKYR